MTPSSSGDNSRIYSFQDREIADAYNRGQAARAQSIGPATELMLDLAGLVPGARVLDVAAGNGEQTVLAARRVGPTGSVLATDIASEMLGIAEGAVREAGLSNVETRVVDAQAIDLEPDSFDAAIVRLGLMLMPNPAAAVAGIHRVLQPGGKLAALVFGPAEHNAYIASAIDVLSRRLGRPPASQSRPGMYALGEPGDLDGLLRQAGFRDVEVHTVPAPRRFPSLGEAVDWLRDASPPARALAADLNERDRQEVWSEIADAIRQFDRPTGFDGPGEVVIAAGTK